MKSAQLEARAAARVMLEAATELAKTAPGIDQLEDEARAASALAGAFTPLTREHVIRPFKGNDIAPVERIEGVIEAYAAALGQYLAHFPPSARADFIAQAIQQLNHYIGFHETMKARSPLQ